MMKIAAFFSSLASGWYLYAALGVAVLLAVGFSYVEYERVVTAKAELASMKLQRDVESQHAKDALAVIDRLQEIKRRETESQQRLAQKRVSRDTTTAQIVKDMANEQGANDPAGPLWDALGERLRAAEGSHQ